MLEQLLKFVASHDMVEPHIEDDAVVFGVEWIDRQGNEGIVWERVSTLSEARDALGY